MKRYGEAYQQYALRTPLLIPWPKRWFVRGQDEAQSEVQAPAAGKTATSPSSEIAPEPVDLAMSDSASAGLPSALDAIFDSGMSLSSDEIEDSGVSSGVASQASLIDLLYGGGADEATLPGADEPPPTFYDLPKGK